MKVAFITTWEIQCGIATYSANLYDSLIDKVNIQIFKIPEYKNKSEFTLLAKNVNKSDCDLVHIQHTPALFGGDRQNVYNLRAFINELKKPFIITLHEIGRGKRKFIKNSSLKSIFKNIKNMLFNYYEKYFLSPVLIKIACLAKKNIVHTAKQKQELLDNRVDNLLINHMIHGIECHQNDENQDRSVLKEKYHLNNKKILLSFGFIKPFKDYQVVIECLSALDNNVVYIIAGKPQCSNDLSYEKGLKELVSEKGLSDRVVFTGFLSDNDIVSFHQMADLLIFPYKHSVGSGALSKALSFKQTIIASNIPVHREINQDQQNIVLYDNQDQLLFHIKKFLGDVKKTEELKKNMDRYVNQNSWENVGIKTYNIYEQVLQKNKKNRV